MIKILKIGDKVYNNLEEVTIEEVSKIVIEKEVIGVDEDGKEIYTDVAKDVTEFITKNNTLIPSDLEVLRDVAIDTIKWQAGIKLKDTDWIVTKIAEIQVTGGDVEAEKEKYADILAERETIRAKSNELEEKINACETYEELVEAVKDLRVQV
ncbi:hypothetical protein RZR97_08190 [Hydrogenimonas thermophila]|uniref:hypothetical protein n=1 Tax=Hydrogenimonas thermophila TaxID=223786 RepID=UPI0029373BC5|nr:hypothetical protein [Hydrogenimonas thermophila]WOE69086.1 hypothetical protein RZR91_08215 [Hydrogenimonas thermophila]WOE71596.1 hypothetical protein RZR97_08190 [Hydrogenimonas thermophila]